jgi:hypothetical protein
MNAFQINIVTFIWLTTLTINVLMSSSFHVCIVKRFQDAIRKFYDNLFFVFILLELILNFKLLYIFASFKYSLVLNILVIFLVFQSISRIFLII